MSIVTGTPAVAFLQLLTIFLYIIFFHIWLLETSQQVLFCWVGWLVGCLVVFKVSRLACRAGADIHLHNIMSMSGTSSLYYSWAILLFAYAIMYAVIPDLTKKKMNKTLGEIHFWLTLFGRFGFVLLFVVIGGEGSIRREASMPGAFDWVTQWLLFFALNVGLAQFIFVYNFVKTIRRKPTKQEILEYNRMRETPTAQGITACAP